MSTHNQADIRCMHCKMQNAEEGVHTTYFCEPQLGFFMSNCVTISKLNLCNFCVSTHLKKHNCASLELRRLLWGLPLKRAVSLGG